MKVWRRRFRTLPQEERDLPLSKKKQLWIDRYKEDERERRSARLERRKRMEEEAEGRGFTLFKRKEPKTAELKRPRQRKPIRSIAQETSKKLTMDEIKELDLDL
jgi:hypothetical protein